ncbi:MAG: DUF2793 domain-containing protein [Beijerinckiaceae bacterium]
MSETPRLKFPLLAAGQAQKHVTMNDALQRLDSLVQLTVLSMTLTAPPATPAADAAYIIPANSTGVWSGKVNSIALWQDGVWQFLTPRPGWVAWVVASSQLFGFDGAAWISAASQTSTSRLGIAATATEQTRLSAASRHILFNHAGGSQQLTINKAATAETASIVLQSGFTGHSEIGLVGANDLAFKVSADGSTFRDAIILENDTGKMRTPLTPHDENFLINAGFTINQRRFTGGSLSAGAFGHDRWKAGPGPANYSVNSGVVSLASGIIGQTVEPEAFGFGSLAGMMFTVSVENPSAAIQVNVAGVSGQITAGTGRRGVTLTLPGLATGNVAITFGALAGGAVSFSRPKLETGPDARPWRARPAHTELDLCQRYYVEFGSTTNAYHCFGVIAMRSSTLGMMRVGLANSMRAEPTVAITGAFVALDGGGSPVSMLGVSADKQSFDVFATFANGTPGAAWPLYASNTTAARITASAEL